MKQLIALLLTIANAPSQGERGQQVGESLIVRSSVLRWVAAVAKHDLLATGWNVLGGNVEPHSCKEHLSQLKVNTSL